MALEASGGPRMMPPTIEFARAARDGGIHAMAALDAALAAALDSLPADHGLSDVAIYDLKLAFGKIMGAIIDDIIDPALHAFPELNPSQADWVAAVVEQTGRVGARAAVRLASASTEPLVAMPPR